MRSKLDISITQIIFAKVYHSYLSVVYGCQLWTDYKLTVLKKAVVVYNNVYRRFLMSNEVLACLLAIYVNTNSDAFTVLIR